jgi:Matrixin
VFRRGPGRTVRLLTAALLAAAIQAVGAEARAFCRTTSACNVIDPQQTCVEDPQCTDGGAQLFWRGGCMSFGVDHEGSPKRGISFEAALATISQAYEAWTTADCGGGQTPALQVFESPKPILCDHQEYNSDGGNANAWVFYDEGWPYPSIQLALTTLSFAEDGEIYDVDVEVNTADHDIAVDPVNGQDDLLSVCTHEAGHFFGLGHSTVAGSTMEVQYQADTSMRSLEDDDIQGICTLFPPDRQAAACEATRTPRHGFSAECGGALSEVTEDAGCCATAPGRGRTSAWPALIALSSALVLLRARRRSRPSAAVRAPV